MTTSPTRADDADDTAAIPGRTRRSGGGDRARTAGLVATVSGLVAVVCAVLLPLLPVSVAVPEVSWPADPAAPVSTPLQLTTLRPLTLDARFDCATARAAAATPDGVVLATASPRGEDTTGTALVATARGDELTVTSRGVPLLTRALGTGPCAVTVRGDLREVALAVDGRVVATAPAEAALPDVDALVTSVPADPARGPDGLAVRLSLDDQFETTPTALKILTTTLLLVAVAVTLAALVVRDRAARRPGVHGPDTAPSRGPPRPSPVDLLVPALIVVWAFLAPMTDDDGYYAAMAGNVAETGYVGNYYQLYNQGFTPFSWIYHVLSWWQSVAGSAPVVVRVPALVLGVATWVLLRFFVHRALPGTGRVRATALRWALAVCFLGWWLPFDMGVRPEAVVALAVVASLAALAVACETGRWSLVAVAVGVASFGVTAAPTGFVALAPLLAGAPAVWRMLRETVGVRGAAAALVAMIAPGSLIGVLAFADGSLRDFTRAQQIFLGMQGQETWYSEIQRWQFLLADDPMGNYAKRTPVLLGLLALAAFLVLLGRGVALPARFRLTGWTVLLGFALLWLTPSKWTHHFGTLAGAGGALLALVVVGGPLLLRAGRAPRWPAVVGAGLLLAVVAALAGHGPNAWPYSWMLGVPQAGETPALGPIAFSQPLTWLLALLVAGGAVAVVARRRAPRWRPLVGPLALGTVTLLALAATTGYMVGGLALAAHRTGTTWSPWADAVRDPSGRAGVAASAIEVLDPASARPLEPAAGVPAPPADPAFAPGGWFPASPPPPGPAANGVEARGSFLPGGGDPDAPVGDEAVGEYTSPWYAIPTDRTGAAMTASVAGRNGAGNELRVDYARQGPDGEVVGVSRTVLDEGAPDGTDSTVWRSLLLEAGAGPPPGATMLRLVARDTSTAPGGWIAVTAPSVQRWTPLPTFLGPRTVAVSWQFAFLFPTMRTPVQAHGLNEPSTAAVVWGDQPLAYRGDGIFQPRRGGLFAQSLRGSEVTQVVSRLRADPEAPAGQVYLMTPFVPAPPGPAYRLAVPREVVPGWSPAPNTTFSDPADVEAAGS